MLAFDKLLEFTGVKAGLTYPTSLLLLRNVGGIIAFFLRYFVLSRDAEVDVGRISDA